MVSAPRTRSGPEAVLNRLADRFGLQDRMVLHYEDTYFATHTLKPFNGRTASLRIRKVRAEDGQLRPERRTIQAVYTKPEEIGRDDPSLFRCFVVRKEKHVIAEEDGASAVILRSLGVSGKPSAVPFSRLVARDPEGLFVSIDVLSRDGVEHATYWIEAKVRADLNLIKAANEFIAMNFPVRGTTKGKFDIVGALDEFRMEPATP